MLRGLYSAAIFLLLPWAFLHLLWRAIRQPDYLRHWHERLGFVPWRSSERPLIWIHAVSVGETRAAQPLIKALQAEYPRYAIALSHGTPTGRATSQELFGQTVERFYLPYDTPTAARRFLRRLRPAIGIIMETEIWPNLIAACKDEKIPLVLANGRLNARSARRYQKLSRLVRTALKRFACITAQTEADAKRFLALGAREVRITGNLKFDLAPPAAMIEQGRGWRRDWDAGKKRCVLVAASTRDGEERLIFEALRQAPVDDLLLVVVPRHPQRFEAVALLAQGFGFHLQRRSQGTKLGCATNVLLGDSMGEMYAYYAAADLAFIGGSLLPYGSQNLIEACALGTPVLIGPSIFNFAAAVEAAAACGAARQVRDAEEMIQVACELLLDAKARQEMSRAGREFAHAHRGATERTLALLAPYLDRR